MSSSKLLYTQYNNNAFKYITTWELEHIPFSNNNFGHMILKTLSQALVITHSIYKPQASRNDYLFPNQVHAYVYLSGFFNLLDQCNLSILTQRIPFSHNAIILTHNGLTQFVHALKEDQIKEHHSIQFPIFSITLHWDMLGWRSKRVSVGL